MISFAKCTYLCLCHFTTQFQYTFSQFALPVPYSFHSGQLCPVQPLHSDFDAQFVGLGPVILWFWRQGEGQEIRGAPGCLCWGPAAAGSLPPNTHCPSAAYTAGRVASPCTTQANHHGTPRDW